MSYTEVVICDQCEVHKQEVNHWIMYSLTGPSVSFRTWTNDWKAYGHLCGESCASKFLSKAIPNLFEQD
jgi:hypothetical protein